MCLPPSSRVYSDSFLYVGTFLFGYLMERAVPRDLFPLPSFSQPRRDGGHCTSPVPHAVVLAGGRRPRQRHGRQNAILQKAEQVRVALNWLERPGRTSVPSCGQAEKVRPSQAQCAALDNILSRVRGDRLF